MCTKKDYVRAAELIRTNHSNDLKTRSIVVHAFVEFFKSDNPRFNPDRFVEACDPKAKK